MGTIFKALPLPSPLLPFAIIIILLPSARLASLFPPSSKTLVITSGPPDDSGYFPITSAKVVVECNIFTEFKD